MRAIPAQVVHPTRHHIHFPASHSPHHHPVATHTHGCPDDHMLAHPLERPHTTTNVLDILPQAEAHRDIDPAFDAAGSVVARSLDMRLEVAVVGGRAMSPGK